MPAAPTRPHLAAVRGLLSGLTVIDGGDGDVTPPCVVLWPTPGDPVAGSLADPDSDLIVLVTTVACGETPDQAMWVADQLTARLQRATPAIAGRTVHPITLDTATAVVSRDDDLAAPLWSTSLTWRLHTTPA